MSQTPEGSTRSGGKSPSSPAEQVLFNKTELTNLNLKMEGYVTHVQKLGEENSALKDRLNRINSLPDPNERKRLEQRVTQLRQQKENHEVEKGREELKLEKKQKELEELKKKEAGLVVAVDATKAKRDALRTSNEKTRKEIANHQQHHKELINKLETDVAVKQKGVTDFHQNQAQVLSQKVLDKKTEWQKESKPNKESFVRGFKEQVLYLEADLENLEEDHRQLKIIYGTLDDELKLIVNPQIQVLRDENRNLQDTLEKQKAEKEREIGRVKKFIDTREGDIIRHKEDLANKHKEISEANDSNVSLRSEILVYKRIIEQEEARLNLQNPPAPPRINPPLKQRPVVAQTPVTSGSSARLNTPEESNSSVTSSTSTSRKRPLEVDDETPEQEEPKARRYDESMTIQFLEKKSGVAVISAVRLQDGTVEIRNVTNPPYSLDLSRYFIQIGNHNLDGTRYFHPLRYKFPDDTSLPENECFDLKITGDDFIQRAEELVTPGFFVQLFDGADELVAEVVLEEQISESNASCVMM